MHTPDKREDKERKPSEFRYPTLDYRGPPGSTAHPPYPARLAEYGSQPLELPWGSMHLSEHLPERTSGISMSRPFAYPQQQQRGAFSPASGGPVNPMYAPSSPLNAHVVPPGMGHLQAERGGTWWYIPGRSQQQQQRASPFSQPPQPPWTAPQSPSPPSPSSPSSSRFSPGEVAPLSRRPYHPSPPAARSEWVMWVGNVPGNTEHDELWYFFTQQPYDRFAGRENENKNQNGVISIFLISRSRCAFVNYESEEALQTAIKRFDGVPMRAADPRAARLVCRVRGNSDDLRAGVGGQRGVGLHVDWVRKQAQAQRPSTHPVGGSSTPSSRSSSSGPLSNASTTSSFLEAHFPQRFFILKSLTQADIDTSVRSGLWATQRHNEDVLDRAFRTSKDVFLIFSVNKSGGFCGYARMQGTIRSDESNGPVEWGPRSVASSAPPDSSPRVLVASPEPERPNEALTDSLSGLLNAVNQVPRSSSAPMKTPLPLPWPPPQQPPPPQDAQTAPPRLGHQHRGISPVLLNPKFSLGQRRPIESTSEEVGEEAPEEEEPGEFPFEKTEKMGEEEGWGRNFKLQWISTAHLPFQRTRHIRNPWNRNREVKVSRDGTEVEPEAGRMLLAEWK